MSLVYLTSNDFGKPPLVFSRWKLAEESLLKSFRECSRNTIMHCSIEVVGVDYKQNSTIKYRCNCRAFANLLFLEVYLLDRFNEKDGTLILEEIITRYTVTDDVELVTEQLHGNSRWIYFNDLDSIDLGYKPNCIGTPEIISDEKVSKYFKYQAWYSYRPNL